MEIDGRAIAKEILNDLAIRVQNLKQKGITPTLAIILVGKNPQSVAYIEQKELRAAKIGAKVIVKKLPLNTSQSVILKTIEQLDNDNNIHGIIVQRPVKGISSEILNEEVSPEKDVDGFNPKSKFDYPIAKAILIILEHIYSTNNKTGQFYDYLRRIQIILIGKGETGGFPIIQTFKKLQVPFKLIDRSTMSPELLTKQADVIISAVGKPGVVRSENLKKGVVLISIGLSKGEDGKMHGDYNEKDIEQVASFYTPTPGGVGPVNVAMLLKNLVDSADG